MCRSLCADNDLQNPSAGRLSQVLCVLAAGKDIRQVTSNMFLVLPRQWPKGLHPSIIAEVLWSDIVNVTMLGVWHLQFSVGS